MVDESIGKDQPVQVTQEVRLFDLALILVRHKKLILGLPIATALIAVVVSLLMPKWYTATARVLPPQQSQSSAVAILGQLGVLSGGASQSFGLKNPSDIFIAMLRSRTVADRLIEKFHLQEIYDEEYITDARKKLKQYSDISAGRDSVITIEVEDKDPDRSANIANAYITELESLTRTFALTEAGQRRLFFENQLSKAKDDLVKAESELRKFQESSGILNVQGQMGLTVAAAAGLRAQMAAKEVQLSALRSFATDENPDLKRAQEELIGLRKQMGKLESSKDSDRGDVLVPIGKAPAASVEYIGKYRDVKYYETLFELLAKQYEIAKIDEAKNATLIQVLDKAIKPDKKTRPKRTIIVLSAFMAALLLAIVGAYALEGFARAKVYS